MDNLGGDNKQQNTPAEIYARIRADAIAIGRKQMAREVVNIINTDRMRAKLHADTLDAILQLCKEEK